MKIAPATLRQMLARNPQLSINENQAQGKVQDAKHEHDKTPTLVRRTKRADIGTPGITVRFTGYRVRPCDPDRYAGGIEYLLDGLRHSGLIPDDNPWEIKLETSQVKVRTYREEWTEIEIIS
jgi:hypothetical protein